MSEDILKIKKQGVYAAGGKVQQAPGTFDPIHDQLAKEGQLRHSDHASVFYQIPADGNGKRVTFLHGYGGNQNTWQTTEFCEGISDMFLRDGYEVYLIDQPRYGHAAQGSEPANITAQPDDLVWFTQFRAGLWPKVYDGAQFPTDPYLQDQFFRGMNPSVGPFDPQVVTDAVVASLKKSGPSVLMTHSQGGIPGWFIAAESNNVTGVVAIEPGTFIFPEDELPEPEPTTSAFATNGKMGCIPVKKELFEKLTHMPIAIYFGDFIPDEPSDIPAADHWRVTLKFARKFADCVNKHGGNATVVHLPEVGIYGNTHIMLQEKNNHEIYEHILGWMKENSL